MATIEITAEHHALLTALRHSSAQFAVGMLAELKEDLPQQFTLVEWALSEGEGKLELVIDPIGAFKATLVLRDLNGELIMNVGTVEGSVVPAAPQATAPAPDSTH